MQCDRCNAGRSRAVLHHGTLRPLCDPCCAVLGVSITDEVRAGVDFLLATEPSGIRMSGILGIIRGAAL